MVRALLICVLFLAACPGSPPTPEEQALADTAHTRDVLDMRALDRRFEEILVEHRIATAGAALIQAGEIAWTGYYGEQTPGVPASRETLFNTGSIAKTVTAEVILRLAEQGVLSLDEPMSPAWIDPDLAEDPRHAMLTPRLALTHRTGFPNWRYMDPEFKLRFLREPGTTFGYSGEGFEYVARFAEAKAGESFEGLARKLVFEPLGLESMANAPSDWVLERIAHPVNEAGERRQPFCTDPESRRCTPLGEWSAADDLATSVEDYAHLLIAVMHGEGVGNLQANRFTIQASTAEDEILACVLPDPAQCPAEQGYGLGWEIFDFDNVKIASHGGSDWSERAMAYFDVETHDGLVLFLNGPSSTSVEALIDGMNALDPGSRVAMLYRGWVDAYLERLASEGTS